MSPQEWSGPSNEGGGWQEAPQGEQPPAENYQQPPPAQPGAPQDPAVQQWQQQSQQTAPQSGGMNLKFDAKMLNFGILLGVLLAWIGRLRLTYLPEVDFSASAANIISQQDKLASAQKLGVALQGTGAFFAVGCAMLIITMMPNVDKIHKLGYLIFAGFVFISI